MTAVAGSPAATAPAPGRIAGRKIFRGAVWASLVVATFGFALPQRVGNKKKNNKLKIHEILTKIE